MAFAIGIGIGTQNSQGEWLEVFYPTPILHPSETLFRNIATALHHTGDNAAISVQAAQIRQLDAQLKEGGQDLPWLAALADTQQPLVVMLLSTDEQSTSVPEVYLKLHLLSHRLVKPHRINLAGIFGLLPNVAWTNEGAIDVRELPQRQLAARVAGRVLEVSSVDKFPKMTNYVVPTGVRVAHTARVRLGAYLGEGTTIMHEGFVNFNAGTEGPGMVEGRISAGVFVGKGSDIGGGASTMGTLSGGNNVVISIGEGCLLGANAGVGIPLGDRCTIEAGLYITAGSIVTLIDHAGHGAGTCKARELAGKSDLLFRRNSKNGAVECLTNKSAIELNEALHKN
ncbi:MAG: 2,3,4,5-tetrahydropyridine-2,6-dicarboxylate N-succinyltransferase [Pseudomonadales bacterium]